MQKLFSEIVGMHVLEEFGGGQPIALVRDIIIDPENGKVVGFIVGKRKMIVPMDIEYIGANMLVHSRDSIVPFDDVMRVQTIMQEQESTILWRKVFEEKTNTYVGRVVDYVINTNLMSLLALHVAKTFFVFQYDEKIISAKSIVRIEKEGIYIKSATEKKKAAEKILEPKIESTPSLA